MKIRFVKRLAIVIAMVAGSSAFGQDYYGLSDTEVETVSYLGGGDKAGKGCDGKGCDDGCGYGIVDGLGCGAGGGGSLFASFDATFFRFHQSGGVHQGGFGAPDDEFDLDFAPRFTLGYVGCGGLGIRASLWDYDDNAILHGNPGIAGNPDQSIIYGIDTHTLDLEAFVHLDLSCRTTLEISGGFRHNSLDQSLIANTPNTVIGGGRTSGNALFFGYDGFGGTVALEGRHQIGIAALYARGRWSVVQGDFKASDGVDQLTIPDTSILQTEIAIGVEVDRCLSNGSILTLRFGGEWQQWNDAIFVVDQFNITNNLNMADASFAGLVAGAELSY